MAWTGTALPLYSCSGSEVGLLGRKNLYRFSRNAVPNHNNAIPVSKRAQPNTRITSRSMCSRACACLQFCAAYVFSWVPTFRCNIGPIFNYQPATSHILEERRYHIHSGWNTKLLRALLRWHLGDSSRCCVSVTCCFFNRASLPTLALERVSCKWKGLSLEAMLWQWHDVHPCKCCLQGGICETFFCTRIFNGIREFGPGSFLLSFYWTRQEMCINITLWRLHVTLVAEKQQ